MNRTRVTLRQLQSEEIATGGDQSHLQQLEAKYKGTETTWEEMCGVKETYHATPDVTDDDLLRGEAMDASPRTETALLAEMAGTPATGVGRGISEEETLAAVASISNPSMPTEAEFLNTDVDMEESPESFRSTVPPDPPLTGYPRGEATRSNWPDTKEEKREKQQQRKKTSPMKVLVF